MSNTNIESDRSYVASSLISMVMLSLCFTISKMFAVEICMTLTLILAMKNGSRSVNISLFLMAIVMLVFFTDSNIFVVEMYMTFSFRLCQSQLKIVQKIVNMSYWMAELMLPYVLLDGRINATICLIGWQN